MQKPRIVQVHPDNPQSRLVAQAANVIASGGIIAYPTDSYYAVGCRLADRDAASRLRQLKGVDSSHRFTLLCRDLSEISSYAHLGNSDYRLLKALTPGPYTFVLRATREVPRRLVHPRRRTIGIRVPDNRVTLALLQAVGQPLMSATVIEDPAASRLPAAANDVESAYASLVELILDGGTTPGEPTTVVDLSEGAPRLLRAGRGDVSQWIPEATV